MKIFRESQKVLCAENLTPKLYIGRKLCESLAKKSITLFEKRKRYIRILKTLHRNFENVWSELMYVLDVMFVPRKLSASWKKMKKIDSNWWNLSLRRLLKKKRYILYTLYPQFALNSVCVVVICGIRYIRNSLYPVCIKSGTGCVIVEGDSFNVQKQYLDCLNWRVELLVELFWTVQMYRKKHWRKAMTWKRKERLRKALTKKEWRDTSDPFVNL